MEKLELEKAKALISAHIRPGCLFSRSFTPEELADETAAGTLWYEAHEGCLLLARRRGEHQILSFALDRGAETPAVAFDRPTVLELAFRPRDAALRDAAADWAARGFMPLLRRVRLTRERGGCPLPAALPLAAEKDLPALRALLRACFDPLTGCLPTDAALEKDVAAGRVLYTGEALLRFAGSGAAREIRQLAVAPQARGQGKGKALLHRFTTELDGRRITVWTAETNAPALRLYESAGFAPDGWQSEVLLWQE